MRGWSNSGRSLSTVSAFGKFAAERYLEQVSRESSEGMIFPWDFRQKWDYGKWWKSNYLNPHYGETIKEEGGQIVRGFKEEKIERQREGEGKLKERKKKNQRRWELGLESCK